MTEQAAWHVKRVTVPAAGAVRVRIWMAGPPLLLALLAAFVATRLEQPLWRSQAQVAYQPPLFLTDTSSLTPQNPPTYPESLLALARSNALAERVVHASGIPRLTAKKFLDHSSASLVAAPTDRPLLRVSGADSVVELSVTNPQARRAVRLTNLYATQLIRFKRDLDVRKIRATLHTLESTIAQFRARGDFSSPSYQRLLDMRDELSQLRTRAGSELVLQPASGVTSFRSHALRSGLLGVLLGATVGIVLVIVVSRRSHGNAEKHRGPSD